MTSETSSPVDPVISPEALARLDGGRIAYVKQILSEEISSLFPEVPDMTPGFRLYASRFPSCFEETGNKRLMDAEVFCEKNRKPRIRWK